MNDAKGIDVAQSILAFLPEMAFPPGMAFWQKLLFSRKCFLAKNNFVKFEVAFWLEMAFCQI